MEPRLRAEIVAQLTGPGSINETDVRWNVHGTDLGHSFEHGGRTYFLFGDSYGPNKRVRRSNLLAWTDDEGDPTAGVRFAGMVTDRRGWARDILPRRLARLELTVIPTYGVSLGDRMLLHYMSVRRWGAPGRWTLNHAGLATSDDDGLTWRRERRARWHGDSGFGQAAFVRDGGFLHLFGIPAGRFGGVRLARVPEESELAPERYEHWMGARWERVPESQAAVIVSPPVGELSVRWNFRLGLWLMMYLDEGRRAIVLRTAPGLAGPWGDARVVATADEYPQLYAPYILPYPNDAAEVYFTMSLYGPYNVFLMRTDVTALRTR
jgi:hypothetical protein